MRQGGRGRVIARCHNPEELNAGTVSVRAMPSEEGGPRQVTQELVLKAGFVPSQGGSLEQRTQVINRVAVTKQKVMLSPLKT